MIADALVCLLLVFVVAFGLSRAFADRLRLDPAETVVAGAGLSLVLAWLLAWGIFVTGLPTRAYAAIPVLAAVSLGAGWRGGARLLRDPAARDLLAGQLLVTGWCVGWLAFIRNHSGGAWTGDSLEHWERALTFLHLWPLGHPYIGVYEMPARPPLANVLAAAFMGATKVDYPHFQVVTAALCSLAFLPVGLLARRFGGAGAVRVAAAVVMLNPLFVQNATYPWTKLQAAFFVLSGLYFFLRVRDAGEASRRCGILCALLLGAAVLTHYSAGPYVVALALAWLAFAWGRGWADGLPRTTVLSALAGAFVLAPWFAWSAATFGWHATLLSNSTASMAAIPGNPLVKMALNLRDTVLPPQLRGFHGTLFLQSSPWGGLRDQFFILYQVNLPCALGIVGWLVAAREAWRASRRAARREARFWALLLAAIVVLSFAAYGDHDHYGIAHICLQSVVLLGLAFLASRWGALGRGWRIALAAGWAVDFCMGIALQFAVEDFAIDHWVNPGQGLLAQSATYSGVSQLNLAEKLATGLVYFSDMLATRPGLILVLLGALLAMALLRLRGARAA
jgi:4-amino-4-deoxy-L-arabinose transferase-like glycosyltransferase